MFIRSDSEVRSGILLLSLEANQKIAEQLLLMNYGLDLSDLDGLKIGLLVIELDNYLRQNYSKVQTIIPRDKKQEKEEEMVEVDEGIDKITKEQISDNYVYKGSRPGEIKYQLESYLKKLMRVMCRHNWQHSVKLHILTKFYYVIKGKKL